MTPNPGAAPAAPKKSGNKGCLIAIAVVFGLFALMCLGGSFLTWRAANTEEGKKIVSVIGKGASLGVKGMSAPGTAELRDAGCRQAIVLQMRDMMEIAAIFVDGGAKESDSELDETFVMCQGNVFDSLPDCETAAKTYVKAVHPASPFTLSVQQQGQQRPQCMKRYDAEGNEIERRPANLKERSAEPLENVPVE